MGTVTSRQVRAPLSNKEESYLEKRRTSRTIVDVTLDWDRTVSSHLLQLQFSMLPAAQ